LVGSPKKLSLPTANPLDVVHVSFSGVIAQIPLWVNGLYWNM
jgi:hypothetical protein